MSQNPLELVVSFRCAACGSPSSFDGNGGEWCRDCQTDEHLVRVERLFVDTGVEWEAS